MAMSEIEKLEVSNHPSEELVELFKTINALMYDQEFSQLNKNMRELVVEPGSVIIALAYLRGTFSVREYIPEWYELLKRTADVVDNNDYDKRILEGLLNK